MLIEPSLMISENTGEQLSSQLSQLVILVLQVSPHLPVKKENTDGDFSRLVFILHPSLTLHIDIITRSAFCPFFFSLSSKRRWAGCEENQVTCKPWLAGTFLIGFLKKHGDRFMFIYFPCHWLFRFKNNKREIGAVKLKNATSQVRALQACVTATRSQTHTPLL